MTCRDEALSWVHRYAIGGAAFAALPLPLTTAGLIALEGHMMKTIADIYEGGLNGIALTATKGALALASQGVKLAARKATSAAPKAVAPVVRAAIAGITIEAIGIALVLYCESKSPGKVFLEPRA